MADAYAHITAKFENREEVNNAVERGELSDDAAQRIAKYLYELEHPTSQLTREDLALMNPEQIQAAMGAGRLRDVLAGGPASEPLPGDRELTMDDLRGHPPEEIAALWRDGRLPFLGDHPGVDDAAAT